VGDEHRESQGGERKRHGGDVQRLAKLYPPRSPFYSAWSVEGFAIEGREIPCYGDPERWRWVTFGKPAGMAVETMDGSPLGFEVEIDERRKTFLLRPPRQKVGEPPSAPTEAGAFAYRQPDGDTLLLEGELSGRRAVLRLEKMALVKGR
jgi:hypothetical protein